MKRLNGWDALLLYSETPNVQMHTLKIAVIDASATGRAFTVADFRRTMAERAAAFDPLRYRLVDIPFKLHRPMWIENCRVDIDYHVRAAHVPPPGGRRELNELIGRIASEQLDRRRPLWEIHFADGLADGKCAVIGKVHHALADGAAVANLMAKAADSDIQRSVEQIVDECALPSRRQLLLEAGRDHISQFRQIPYLVRDTAAGIKRLRRHKSSHTEHAPARKPRPTFLNHAVAPQRTFATTTLSLADIKETSKHLGVTINDLVLAMTAGALRQLLRHYDGSADDPIVVSVPVSTDPSTDRISGNALAGVTLSLPVHIADPIERVRLTRAAATEAKERHELLGPPLPGRWLSYVPPAIFGPVMRRLAQRDGHNNLYNVSVSNVPGPRQRRRFAGVEVTEFYSVGPLTFGTAVNITVWSYVDQLNIAVLSDDRTLGDTHEVTEAMVHALSEIRCAAGLPGDLATVDIAMNDTGACG